MDLTATLMEYGVPVDHRAGVWADITRPDGSQFTLTLPETDPGRFERGFVASLTGLYSMRVRAIGSTFRGTPFEREQDAQRGGLSRRRSPVAARRWLAAFLLRTCWNACYPER